MQINGPNVGLVSISLLNNVCTPTDAATFNDVVGVLDKKTNDPSPIEAELNFLNTWVLNNPNYPSAPAIVETAETTAEISSIDLGETAR